MPSLPHILIATSGILVEIVGYGILRIQTDDDDGDGRYRLSILRLRCAKNIRFNSHLLSTHIQTVSEAFVLVLRSARNYNRETRF